MRSHLFRYLRQQTNFPILKSGKSNHLRVTEALGKITTEQQIMLSKIYPTFQMLLSFLSDLNDKLLDLSEYRRSRFDYKSYEDYFNSIQVWSILGHQVNKLPEPEDHQRSTLINKIVYLYEFPMIEQIIFSTCKDFYEQHAKQHEADLLRKLDAEHVLVDNFSVGVINSDVNKWDSEFLSQSMSLVVSNNRHQIYKIYCLLMEHGWGLKECFGYYADFKQCNHTLVIGLPYFNVTE